MSAWPSLRWAPEEAAGWLAMQEARVDDPAFAALFEGVELPGVVRMDFAHRHVRTARGDVLGGIRFFGQDVARPFVEVVAHGLGLAALREVVAAEWAAFAPRALRLLVAPSADLPADAALDVTVHCARYGEMRPPDGRVALDRVEPEVALALVRERYDAMEPALRRDVSPAGGEDLARWREAGDLHGIAHEGERVGVLATEPGGVAWIEGDVVAEEVIAAPFAGRGLAASAQGVLASRRDPHRRLVGTIAAGNAASRRTAERAGRPEVMRHVFLPLPGGARRP